MVVIVVTAVRQVGKESGCIAAVIRASTVEEAGVGPRPQIRIAVETAARIAIVGGGGGGGGNGPAKSAVCIAAESWRLKSPNR